MSDGWAGFSEPFTYCTEHAVVFRNVGLVESALQCHNILSLCSDCINAVLCPMLAGYCDIVREYGISATALRQLL